MDDRIAALIQRFQQLRGGMRPGNAFAGGSGRFREQGRAIPTGPIGDFMERLPPGANPYPPGLGPSANNGVSGVMGGPPSDFAPGGKWGGPQQLGSIGGGNMPPPGVSREPGNNWGDMATTDMGMPGGERGQSSFKQGVGNPNSIGIPWNASMGGANGPPVLGTGPNATAPGRYGSPIDASQDQQKMKTLAEIMQRAGAQQAQPVNPWGSGGPMGMRQRGGSNY